MSILKNPWIRTPALIALGFTIGTCFEFGIKAIVGLAAVAILMWYLVFYLDKDLREQFKRNTQ